jgi:asparagine synthase (glutamine-hydrolysing)
MCGIAVFYGLPLGASIVEEMLRFVQYRGYKNFEIGAIANCALGANRLDIVDRDNGRQPCWNEDGTICVVLSGEIYNHDSLRALLTQRGHRTNSYCDTEILVHCYEEFGLDFVNQLDGMFAFVLYDSTRDRLLAVRDPFGIKPLYMAYVHSGRLAFASEIKSFIPLGTSKIHLLPPGSMYMNGEIHRYYDYPSTQWEGSIEAAQDQLRTLLHNSVKKMVKTNLPVAVFVSGGVDSAIILHLAQTLHPNITAISVGLTGSPDLSAAKELCSLMGVKHIWEEYAELNLEEIYETVVYHLESFEPNLVRASIFTWLMSRLARRHGFRIALAGEGSDELFGGYADFAEIEDEAQLQSELRGFFKDLHQTQLLRWDKIGMAFAVEVRYPFMDRNVVEFAWNLPINLKVRFQATGGITKYLLRTSYHDLLPQHIAYREKIPMDEGACGSKLILEQLIHSHVSKFEDSYIDSKTVEEYKLNSTEERYNFLAYRKHYNFEGFGKERVKVRKK